MMTIMKTPDIQLLLTQTTVAGVKRLAESVCVCVFVCPHGKTQTAEIKITILDTVYSHEYSFTN